MDKDPKNGQFVKGNKASRGNPHAAKVAKLRSAMLAAMTPDAVVRIIAELETLAESGDVQAIKEYLDRAVGKPIPLDVIERLEQVEAALGLEVPNAE